MAAPRLSTYWKDVPERSSAFCESRGIPHEPRIRFCGLLRIGEARQRPDGKRGELKEGATAPLRTVPGGVGSNCAKLPLQQIPEDAECPRLSKCWRARSRMPARPSSWDILAASRSS